ncbi:MAG: hypothetical protein ALECFALPRED_007454 [Alectoria fallacina]|uniref:Uncharacterized protein n=1 Tax=Alectoria fallacina TaxID=1903189 RepID=A0A8H3GD74_9LECA|nr:MAG: hypothetical protein ALECFALPRED_007454 [Alectoria fallacina]
MSEHKSINPLMKKDPKAEGPEPSQEFREISYIMLNEDENSLDMIGVYYNLGNFFGSLGKDRKLETDELVDVIKSHNTTAYAKLTYDMCLMLRNLSANPLYITSPQYRKTCRGQKWVSAKIAVVAREYKRDDTNQAENEALYIYQTIVKEADELKKGGA